MTRRVWLVRHASTDWTGRRWCGTTDLALNRQGRVEAEMLAASVAARLAPGVDIVSSPLRRAIETADRVASATGSLARIDGRLREVDFGDAEGLDWSELDARHPDLAQAVAARDAWIDWPGGESAADVRSRAQAVWRDISARRDGVVLVTHGGFIRALLARALAGPPAQVDLELGPASVVELARRDGTWAIAG
jgi:ribonuclease H / adenosylcobalamin/alpha-ribazole phosphatase